MYLCATSGDALRTQMEPESQRDWAGEAPLGDPSFGS